MPSRIQLTPLSANKTPTADDVNLIYHILNGTYSNTRGSYTETNTRGYGMSVQFTNYDGRLSSGLIDVAKYALEVRNRESTAQKTFAARRADNKIVFSVEGGLAYAVKDTDSGTTPTQVIVHGTPAGGVLSGTYPNPSGTEYNTIYPTMIVAWYGDATTTLIGGNWELINAPGWVICDGSSVTLRNGTSGFATPDMRDRLPIGAGTSVAYKGTTGNSWTALASVSIAHGHTITGHTHTIAHNHGLNSHTHSPGFHTHTINDHAHGQNGHTHTMDHGHALSGVAQTNGVVIPASGSTYIASSTAPLTLTVSQGGHTHIFPNDVSISGSAVALSGASTGGPSNPNTQGSGVLSTNSPSATSTGAPDTVFVTAGSGTANSGDSGTLTMASQTTLTSINARPPVLGWHWIMKL